MRALRGVRRGALELEAAPTDPEVRRVVRELRASLDLPADAPLVRRVGGRAWLPREVQHAAIRAIAQTSSPRGRALRPRHVLRPDQAAAADALAGRSGVLEAPCGAGKTQIGIELIARAQTPALVLVHTLDLQRQWIERVRSTLPGVRCVDAPDAAGDVAVLMVQTLTRWTAGDLARLGARFGAVLVDEAHHVPADTFAHVVASLPCALRWGLTATPTRADGLHGLLFAHVGPVRHRIAVRDLQASGATLAPEVHIVRTGSDRPEDDSARDTLIRRRARELAASHRLCLVLVRRVDHARELARTLGRSVPTGLLVGDLAESDRATVLGAARAGRIGVIVATSLADEGLDLPELGAVILGSPTSSIGRVQQRIGRALRPRPGKRRPIVLDLVDANPAHDAAATERRAFYRSQGWTIREAA